MGTKNTGTRLRTAAVATALVGSVCVAGQVFGDEPGTGVPAALAGWKHTSVDDGADLYEGVFDDNNGVDYWTVTVKGDIGDLHSLKSLTAAVQKLKERNVPYRAEPIEWPEEGDRSGLAGTRVRVGRYTTAEEARAEQKKLAGFRTSVEWTGADGALGGGRTEVQVVLIDPKRFTGSLTASHGATVSGPAKVTDRAAAAERDLTTAGQQGKVLVGTNGSFFTMPNDPRGIEGGPVGIAAYNGELQSAAVQGRVAAILRGNGLGVEFKNLTTETRVRSGSESSPVNGINRLPGTDRNCHPPQIQRALTTVNESCSRTDEIVRFTDELGRKTPGGAGVEAVLNGSGRVTELRARGGEVPQGGSVLAGIGTGETWLRGHAVQGSVLSVQSKIFDEEHHEVPLGKDDDIISGAPQLLRDGRIALNYGGDKPEEISLAYTYALKAAPRTLLGVDAQGRVLLVTSNGRKPGISDGLSLLEAAELMRTLGARQAVNLDGGGSTTMAVKGRLVNTPSDGSERPIGDALLLIAGEQAASNGTRPAPPSPPAPSTPPVSAAPSTPPAAGSVSTAPSTPPAAGPVSAAPSMPPAAGPVPAGTCTAPPWDGTRAYQGGEAVSHKSMVWRAKWWIGAGEEPGAYAVWEAQNPC
ncbi:phosphodiester glycosidase family protein [Streptomyces actinomycinicus]|uniref:Phosphodiester glycosidase family protein n=1 Tax=Streptomyces actinomycinicus TaxID=1695166 RepID=A0A937JQU0_9ACTN|nr:phosphodiester glycosidase family protein [Streptomyces actinomycinicus]MBL1083788.1 phosphodiester glycosidase family protein [Streptomyces actinomycinicus]